MIWVVTRPYRVCHDRNRFCVGTYLEKRTTSPQTAGASLEEAEDPPVQRHARHVRRMTAERDLLHDALHVFVGIGPPEAGVAPLLALLTSQS